MMVTLIVAVILTPAKLKSYESFLSIYLKPDPRTKMHFDKITNISRTTNSLISVIQEETGIDVNALNFIIKIFF